ncbi:MazG family protein [Segeticoccus rhizosphaerae]|uniref:MazG family protein n=2 Tax=Segeticoccus rhizosphaerae TaxID=1104777 RepID=UPI0010C00BBB|nr:MazG family protein [Ornithinicoccus soli]
MAARLTVLLTSPRVAGGLLSHGAWTALDEADAVLVRSDDEPQVAALLDAGMTTAAVGAQAPQALARTLVERALDQVVVWVGSADGDPGLTDALAGELTRHPEPPEVEILVGSWDVPGARLLDLVAVMDRLRSPGGCPWDAEQTHESLVPYLLEEAHEAVEAIESGDRQHMVEELGDLLLQVAFHARVGQEDPDEPFDVDDVAAGIVDKLVRRHPHVFADVDASTPAEVEANWETIKAAEKPSRSSPFEGIPVGMPPLARAAKVAGRLERAGRQDLLDQASADEGDLGAQLLRLVIRARAEGRDPSAALRAILRTLERQGRDAR